MGYCTAHNQGLCQQHWWAHPAGFRAEQRLGQNTNCCHETYQEESCKRSKVGRLDTGAETRNDFLTVPTYSPFIFLLYLIKGSKSEIKQICDKVQGWGMYWLHHSISSWFPLFFFSPADSPHLKYMANTCSAVFCRTSLFETMTAMFLLHSVYTLWNINLSIWLKKLQPGASRITICYPYRISKRAFHQASSINGREGGTEERKEGRKLQQRDLILMNRSVKTDKAKVLFHQSHHHILCGSFSSNQQQFS